MVHAAGIAARGVDVARILLDAHAAGAGVDQAVAAVTTTAAAKSPAPTAPAPAPTATPAASGAVAPPARDVLASRMGSSGDPWGAPPAGRVPAPAPAPGTAPAPAPAAPPVREAADPWAPPASTDAKRSWGPLTEGLPVPRDLDLGDRAKALEQLGVNRLAQAAIVSAVKDVLPEKQAGLLVGSRQWPLLAARMDQIRDHGGTGLFAAHLARLRHHLEGRPVLHHGGPPRGRDPALPDDTALHPGRARVPRPCLPGGGPLPLHDHPCRRGPRTVGPGRSRDPRPAPAGRSGQGRGAYAVTATLPHPDAAGAVSASGCGRTAYGRGRAGGRPPAGPGSAWRGC
ncbi:hypothetical protein [Streptomyces sp. NPDC059949]|uniref:hypothetical protein n=1 Tax=Streptomyces sp. NPDC059949 TaxID=3347013 RepID=UPI003655F30F